MLGLKLPTDPRWVNLAEKSIQEILTDHAYCEQKAASSGISLIVLFPELEELVQEVAPVVDEEWGHFRMVLDELKKRNLKLGRQRKDEYVAKINQRIKGDGGRESMLLNKLLICALIEARSCERFKLLSVHCSDISLRSFYKKLMVSEAGHYTLFLSLAKKYIDPSIVEKRWNEILKIEAEIMQELELRGDRMH
jgi:tRNA-(ms[2]io[6]A)-hydroxylase